MAQKIVPEEDLDISAHRFVVGVDFGTTYTAVAFAHSASPDVVKMVRTWPNGGAGSASSSADQVPTELFYTDPLTREKIWGYEVTTNYRVTGSSDPLRWFKLLLQNTKTRRPLREEEDVSTLLGGMRVAGLDSFHEPHITPADKTAQMLEHIGIEPVAVVTDFLTSVRELTIASIEQTYDTEWVRNSKIQYILTVPAIWSDSSKEKMIQAAKDAGFGIHRTDFYLVSEPEAAAAYTLKAIQPHEINRGDTFIICDAGGGTVDLISYQIKNLNPLQIDESVSGTGGLCGSVFLDQRFEEYIRDTLGDSTIDNMKPRCKAEMMRTWEEKVKYKFGNSSDYDYDISVMGIPDDDDTNVEDGFHTIYREDVQKIFDPVVDRIIELVNHQVDEIEKKGENLAAILLVGGFGTSDYLLKRLEETMKQPVKQPMHARSAIVLGALMRGLDGSMVKKRRARRFYGCVTSSWWYGQYPTDICRREVDDHLYWCSRNDHDMISGHLNWFVERNYIVGRKHSAVFDLQRMVAVPNDINQKPDLVFETDLLGCDLDNAPSYKWQDRTACYTVCTLVSDLSKIPLRKFIKVTNSRGKEFYRVLFQLKMTIEEVIKFELLFDGESCGSVSTKFE